MANRIINDINDDGDNIEKLNNIIDEYYFKNILSVDLHDDVYIECDVYSNKIEVVFNIICNCDHKPRLKVEKSFCNYSVLQYILSKNRNVNLHKKTVDEIIYMYAYFYITEKYSYKDYENYKTLFKINEVVTDELFNPKIRRISICSDIKANTRK